MKIKKFKGGFDNNFFYILISEKAAVVIDCFSAQMALDYLNQYQINLKYIISTHNHFDHIAANEELAIKTKAKKLLFQTNTCDIPVSDQEILNFGNSTLKFIHTPGHTPDSMCVLVNEKCLFTGDTLFVGALGRIFYEGGEIDQKESLKKIFNLNPQITIYPGHDYGETETSIIAEQKQIFKF